MTQKDKNLLLQDLYGRLPYGVKLLVPSWNEQEMEYISKVDTLYSINGDGYIQTACEDYNFSPEDIKPYLFPLSSMTEEQEEELKNIYYSFNGMFHYTERIFDGVPFKEMKYFPYQIEEFFKKNHLDYRGLIPMGLAIDSTELKIY